MPRKIKFDINPKAPTSQITKMIEYLKKRYPNAFVYFERGYIIVEIEDDVVE